MTNKPKIKDTFIYFDPIIGNVTLIDIINILRDLSNQVKEYEKVTFTLLENYHISDEIKFSLFHLLSSSIIDDILDELEANIE